MSSESEQSPVLQPVPALPVPAGPAVQPGARGHAPAPRRLGHDALLLVLALMALTYIWRVQDLFPPIGRISPALTVTIAALVLWFFDADRRRRLHLIDTPTLRLLLGLIVFMLLSVPGSLWPGNSVRFLYQDFGLTVVFMLLVAVAIRGTRDLEWFAMIHVLGATMYSAVVLARGKVSADGRLSGLNYYDANDLALVLVCTLPLTVYFMRKEVRPWLRGTALICFILLTLTVVKTGSRGGFVGLLVTMGYILFQFRAIKKGTRIAAAVAGIVVLTVVGSETYWTRIQSILRPQEDYNWSENNLAGRKAIWTRGVGYMLSRPLFGVGVRCFPQAEGMLSSVGVQRTLTAQGFKWSAAHNSFVEVGAELGLPALILFVLAFLRSIKTLARLPARAGPATVTPADGALAQALIGSLLGYIVSGFFLSQAYSAYLYGLFGLVIGLTKLYPHGLAARAARPVRRGRASWPVAPATGLPLPGPGDARP